MPGILERKMAMEEPLLSRYQDYRINGHKVYRVEVCIAEIRYNTAKGKKHKYYASACKFRDGTIRIYQKRYASATAAQMALDWNADKFGWRYTDRNSRMPVIDYNRETGNKRELVPVYN